MTSRTGLAALAFSCFVSAAWAQTACIQPADMKALQVAAVQQRFMVAALSCNAAEQYNNFVKAYRPDLQKSDEALQAYFVRRNAATGMADYHAYKTRLANVYSTRSATNLKAFCSNAAAFFLTAVKDKKPLDDIVSTQPIALEQGAAACGETIAGGAMTVQGPAEAKAIPANLAKAAPAPDTASVAAAAAALAPAIAAAPVAPTKAEAEQPKLPESSRTQTASNASEPTVQNDPPPARPSNSFVRPAPPPNDGRFAGQRANDRRYSDQNYADQRYGDPRYATQRYARPPAYAYGPRYPYGPGGYDYRYDDSNYRSRPAPYPYNGYYGYYGRDSYYGAPSRPYYPESVPPPYFPGRMR